MMAQDNIQSNQKTQQYQLETISLNQKMYRARCDNDELLSKITQQLIENSQNKKFIQQFEDELPIFLRQWWKSQSGLQKLSIALQKLQGVLEQQIDDFQERISALKIKQYSMKQDYECFGQQNQALQQSYKLRTQQLRAIKQENAKNQEELRKLLAEKQQSIRKLELLQKECQLQCYQSKSKEDKKNIIKACNGGQYYQSSQLCERDYYQRLESIICRLLDRKFTAKEALQMIQFELDSTNKLISQFDKEKKGNQIRKEVIIQKRIRVMQLQQELRKAKQRTREAKEKQNNLQKLYCEKEMEAVEEKYQIISNRYSEVLGKTLRLVNQSTLNPSIEPIQSILFQTNK